MSNNTLNFVKSIAGYSDDFVYIRNGGANNCNYTFKLECVC